MTGDPKEKAVQTTVRLQSKRSVGENGQENVYMATYSDGKHNTVDKERIGLDRLVFFSDAEISFSTSSSK
jgi:hypothetical protein